jgi:hypothetical protein
LRAPLLFLFPALLLAGISPFYGESTEVKPPPPVDIIATGGAGVTSYDKFGIIFMNPAAFALHDDLMVSLLRAGISANYDLYNYYNIYNFLSQNGNDFTQLNSQQWQQIINARAELGAEGPLAAGFLWQGAGILFYNDMQTTLAAEQNPGLPYFNFDSYFDFNIIAGYGFKIPIPVFLGKFTAVYCGLSVKYINRLEYSDPRMSLLSAYDAEISFVNFQRGFM